MALLARRNCLPPSVFGAAAPCVQPDPRLFHRRLVDDQRPCALLPIEQQPTAADVVVVKEEEQWTEIGEAISASFRPVTTLLRKNCDVVFSKRDLSPSSSACASSSCASSSFVACAACVDEPVVGENGLGGAMDDYDVFTPAAYRLGIAARWPQESAAAYERKTQWTNYGIGYGFSAQQRCALPGCYAPSGARSDDDVVRTVARFAADGPNLDLFSHPRTTIALPNVRRYRLYARQIVGGCTSRWQYAVLDAASTEKPSLLVLASDPRQPPFTDAPLAEYGNYMLNGGLQTGDQIYVPGEFGVYDVYLYIDRTDVFRQEKSVFRGYSPVRRLPGQKNPAGNSGLRNFTSHPSANALIFPY